MSYQYLAENVNPFKVSYFNQEHFWKLICFHDGIGISFNNKTVPLFKVDIDRDYYFIFAALKTVNNLMDVHICVGNCILKSFKIEFAYKPISDTRKLIAKGDYHFVELFKALAAHPLVRVKGSLKQLISITSKFDYALTFNFNSSYCLDTYRKISFVVNYLIKDENNFKSSSVDSKSYTVYLMADDEIALEKRVDDHSDLGIILNKFQKFTEHTVYVLGAIDNKAVYITYVIHNMLGIIKANLETNIVTHTRSNKNKIEVAVIVNPVNMDEAFFGVFNRYFAASLINYPSEYFKAFAEQYVIDIDNIEPNDCLTLIDMATV